MIYILFLMKLGWYRVSEFMDNALSHFTLKKQSHMQRGVEMESDFISMS